MESRDVQTPHGVMRVSVKPEPGSIDNPHLWDEAMSDADARAWVVGDWEYVVVHVDRMHGCDQCSVPHYSDDSASMGMVAMGRGDGWTVTMDDLISTYPVPDLIAEIVAASQKGK